MGGMSELHPFRFLLILFILASTQPLTRDSIGQREIHIKIFSPNRQPKFTERTSKPSILQIDNSFSAFHCFV